jgi:antitoxin (DNA-binding transcriptional repressor) of toxin-antitoxin stability system
MKNVNASEARKNWFRLLDEALDGEVIVVQRKGRRLVLRREEAKDRKSSQSGRYKTLLRAPQADRADQWSWEWRGSGNALASKRKSR